MSNWKSEQATFKKHLGTPKSETPYADQTPEYNFTPDLKAIKKKGGQEWSKELQKQLDSQGKQVLQKAESKRQLWQKHQEKVLKKLELEKQKAQNPSNQP